MLAKQHRFHGRNSLSLAYRHGSTVRNQHMSLKFIRNRHRTTYRTAVIVSRKVHKSAVNRNRIRRRIYEIIRAEEMGIIEPYDLILTIFSDQVIDMPPPKLNVLVVELLTKAGIIKPTPLAPIETPHAIVKTKEERS